MSFNLLQYDHSRLFSLQILYCDNLHLPFRDSSLDAVLSVAVIHHIVTVERRVRAIREIARTLKVGGRVMISVWAMEQRHRKVRKTRSYSVIILSVYFLLSV